MIDVGNQVKQVKLAGWSVSSTNNDGTKRRGNRQKAIGWKAIILCIECT